MSVNKFISAMFLFATLLSCNAKEGISDASIVPGANRLDILLPKIEGKNIGIVANHASLVGSRHLIDSLLHLIKSGDVNSDIEAVFSPEHGFSGLFDAGKVIHKEDIIFDSIRVISLYGKNKKPGTSDLKDIDLILFDLQDVGVRFYTYISTLHYVMEACAENNIDLIILDRPNPHINYVDGPVLEPKFKSFVGMHEVPVVYGMTIGEYGMMINGERWLADSAQCKLSVISILNYSRSSQYSFPVKPSPNLPNMRSVLLYPSLCLFEGTVMSVGRGTSYPFQVVGHPDYPADSFQFTPVSTPGASLYPKLQDELCNGRSFVEVPLDSLWNTKSLDIDVLLSIYAGMGKPNNFFTDYFTLLAGTKTLQDQVENGFQEKEIRDSWKPGLNKFEKIRSKYLLYD